MRIILLNLTFGLSHLAELDLLKLFEKHITVTLSQRTALDELSPHCSLSIGQLKQAINKGALWLTRAGSTQRLRRFKKKLQPDDILHFYYNETLLAQIPADALLIADLQEYSVWYKPYGMLSQGSKWSDHCTISRWAQTHLTPERPAFIVHRLDRAATGLILVAHTKKIAQAFSMMFEKHQLEKYYHIIVHGNHFQRPQPDIINVDIDGKRSRSTFNAIEYNQQYNLTVVQVKIDSGRKHQIRKHAASINMPVVGDRAYGLAEQDYCEQLNLQLCAVSLRFTCPVTQQEKLFELSLELRPQIIKAISLLAIND